MKTIKNCIIILILLIFSENILYAQSNLEKGWDAFYKNNRKEARDFFGKAMSDANSKAEASLALAFINEVDGKNDAAFKNFQTFFSTSENPYPYLYALWHRPVVFSYDNKLDADKIDFLKTIINDPKANGTLKAMAHASLGNHYAATNNSSKSNEEYDKIGSIAQWQLAGEFENISASGFDKTYDPISNPQSSSVFTNKNGVKVKWFTIVGNRMDKWVDLTYHLFTNNSIIYAQTFINSPTDQQVQLRIGTSGSIKAWVNDALVLFESEELNNDLDTYNIGVKLNKGNNRVLLQIGSSEIDRSNFLVRITDENGNPIESLQASSEYQDYAKANTPVFTLHKIFAEDYFENKIKQEPEQICNYLILSAAYLRNDKAYEARKILLSAEKKEPECSYIKTDLIEAYARDDNETEAGIAIEWLKEHDAENLLSMNLFYNEEIKKESYEEAQKILKNIESAYGEDEASISKKIDLLGNLKMRDEMLQEIEKAYSKYPEYYDFVNLKSLVEQQINKNYNAGVDVYKKYLKNNYSIDAQKSLSTAYFAKGDAQAGLTAYAEIIKHEPYSCGTIYTLAQYYFKIRDYNTSVRYYKDAIAIAPYVNYFWAGLAECYENMSRKSDAITAYQRAIEYMPTDYESRTSLRRLLDKPEIFSYFDQPDVYDIIKKASSADKYPEDNSLVLENEVQKIVYAGGASEEKHIFVIKVFNQQGIDDWKEYWINYNSMQTFLIEKAEVVKAKGSKVEAEVNDSHIVFTTLEAGDAIHITYRLKNYLTGKLAPHFWDDFNFSHWYPTTNSKYSLLIDPQIKFKYEFSKNKIEPIVKKADEFDIYIWKNGEEASVSSEDKMPALADVANVLYLSSFPDWKYISNWYYDLASTKAKSDFEVKEVVNTLFEGKNNLTQLQKARIIYDYIITNIHYSSVSFLQSGLIPQKASKVINTKIGDCKDVSTLFVAMCNEAGIKADWVLINTRDGGANQNILPSIEFNHCIAHMIVDGKDYFIELTSDALPFNSIYTSLRNAEALPIYNEWYKPAITLLHLNPTTRNQNLIVRNTDISLTGEDVSIKKSTIKTGTMAAGMRSTYRDIGEQEQKKTIQKAIASDYSNVQLTLLTFKNLKSTADSIEYRIEYNASDALTNVGGLKLLNLPWSEKTLSDDFTFNDSRKYPIDLWKYTGVDLESETITLHIPAALHLSEVPKPLVYTCAIADYSLTYKIEANKLTITRKFNYKKNLVELNEIPSFKDFYKKIVAADNKPIAFK